MASLDNRRDHHAAAEPIGRLIAEHRAEIARKVAALRQAEAATEEALARYDERWGDGQ